MSNLRANEILIEALTDCDHKKFDESKSNIKNIGKKTNDIDNNIIKVLALYSPEARDLREIVAYFKITNELNRACSSSRSFIKGFNDICTDIDKEIINKYALPLQKSTTKSIILVKQMLENSCDDEIRELYNEVIIEENKTDDLYELIEKNLLTQKDLRIDDFNRIHNMLKTLRKSAKVADRSVSIASLLLYIGNGGSLQQT